jgi:2-polyprenyl-6-methoxyphenol hydroxylase-like FAD-dependent oxidoreductase
LPSRCCARRTFDRRNWVARYGVVVERRPGDQHGIFHTPLVNTVRAQISERVAFIKTKAQGIATSAGRQNVTLANGEIGDARPVLLANGLSVSLRDQLNLKRAILSACHSITIGFTMKPRGRAESNFPALTYYAERPADRAALITMFPIGSSMRANLFVYRELEDTWLLRMRRTPQEALYEMMPGLRRLAGDFDVDGRVEIRPIDLYVTHGHLQPGLVLAGDAFATSCPAAGTGARKVLTDIERLCNVHIPRWLSTPGMGEDKIAAFYDDPVKRACDDFAAEKACQLKAFSLDTSPSGRLRRLSKFAGQAARGTVRGSLPKRPLATSDGVLLGTR